MLGLICDPVAGLVEVPCVRRNAMGASYAMVAADMALAGIESKSLLMKSSTLCTKWDLPYQPPSVKLPKEALQLHRRVVALLKKFLEKIDNNVNQKDPNGPFSYYGFGLVFS